MDQALALFSTERDKEMVPGELDPKIWAAAYSSNDKNRWLNSSFTDLKRTQVISNFKSMTPKPDGRGL